MCGIAGILSADAREISIPRLRAMADAIAHRGPEGEGFWTGADGRVGFGHRRLAVIDLTDEGCQPMHYAEGRYTIVYNGEIYNYLELKEGLRALGYVFRSGTDTEVILALYDQKKESCLDDLDGMFAFALYDAREQTLFCARDRFGEKPFYYAHVPGKWFVFGSEMKALWAGGNPRTVNGAMLYNYLSFGVLQNVQDRTETFFTGISRLENGHSLTVSLSDLSVRKHRYWTIDPVSDLGPLDEGAAVRRFRDLMHQSVQRRLRSDVAVGSSLSGGLDSTLVLRLIRECLGTEAASIPVFSARFPGFALDEGTYIQLAADQERGERHDCFPDGEGCWAALDQVFHHQEEPFGSTGIYAQYVVMQSAREQGVTVLLDGQGADELLAGYPHYHRSGWRTLLHRRSPGWARRIKGLRDQRLTRPLLQEDFYAAYRNENYLPGQVFDYRLQSLNGSLQYDTMIGGLSDLLRYADRNAMAHSREVRLPFLNHELVAFLLSLPARAKVRDGLTKYLLRLAYKTDLPAQIASRRNKIGFEPPQRSWMTEESCKEKMRRAMARLQREGIVRPGNLDRSVVPQDAYEGGNGSWRLLMASLLFPG